VTQQATTQENINKLIEFRQSFMRTEYWRGKMRSLMYWMPC